LNAESVSGPSKSPEPNIDIGIGKTASIHGNELLRRGFTVDQVVHDYGDLCQAITELAIEGTALITNNEFQTLNRCLDNAIADAVSEFARERERVVADASEQTQNERLGFLAHEFRNLINTAMLAMNVIKRGNVGIAGSTGAILDRSLKRLQNLCARLVVDVRLTAGIPHHRERVLVSEFIEETEVSAMIDASARGLELIVPDVEPGLAIEVDPEILAGALANLLHNAFKFTRSHGRVSLKTCSSADRVLIEVEDECGGLPPGDAEDLFRLFEQRSGNRCGLGLGLAISRRGVEANGGELHVHNLPGRGCVFTIDLPKSAPAR
jgi:signal transduction histidine kinase